MNSQMMPVLVLQFSERRQDATKIQFRRVDGFETLWSLVEVGAKAKQPGPRQIRSNIVDHDATDRAAQAVLREPYR